MRPQPKPLRSILLCSLVFSSLIAFAQPADSSRAAYAIDRSSLGLGLGIDYGGIGGQLLIYPQRNIGIFGGVGYAVIGIGYNVGTKLRLLPTRKAPGAVPFLIAMYGYNAAIRVSDSYGNSLDNYNKFFYGPSVGAGVDIYSKKHPAGYWTLDVILPVRSPDVDNYINSLGPADASPAKKPFSVLASFAYHFIRPSTR